MDVSTPAPKMKLPVKDQDTKEHDRPATLPRGRNDKRQRRSISGVEKNTAATDISQASSIPGGVLLDQLKIMPGNGILGQYAQVPGLFPNLSSISGNPAMFIRPNVSFPLGSHLSQSEQQEFCFGGDQVWLSNPSRPSDSQNTTPPNQSHQSRSGSSESSGRNNFVPMGIPFNAMSSGLDSFYPAFGTAGYPLVPTQGSVLNLSFPPQISSDGAMDPPTVPGASKQYETLTAQLARLDRYMAVHTWDLDYRSKKLLVEERMNLVRDLDAIRLYKEQLETTFGPVKIGSGETESETNTHGPRGQLSQNQSVHIPRFSASAASNAPALFGPPAVLPVDDPFSSDVQCQGKGDVYSCEDNTGFGGMATGGPSGGWSYQEADTTGPGKQNAHCKTGNSTEFDSQGGLDAWTAPTKSAPPDIGRIYQRIEEATRNGAPIGGLLQELAEVTTRFVQQVTEEQKASRNLEARWDSRTNVTTARPSTTVSKGAYPVPRPTHTTGRQWKSEECAPTSVNDLGSAPDEVDEEGEEESCTSSCSTTDSWATIQGER